MNQRGFTFMEVMIVLVVLGIMFGALYGVLSSSASTYDSEIGLHEGQFNVHLALDRMAQEIRESSAGSIHPQTYADPLLGTTETLYYVATARNSSGAFVTSNATPVWQAISVYAPYVDPADPTATRTLRRYRLDAVANVYYAPGNPNLTVSQTTISAGAVSVQRSSGETVLTKYRSMTLTPSQSSYVIDLTVDGHSSKNQRISMETGGWGRNN